MKRILFILAAIILLWIMPPDSQATWRAESSLNVSQSGLVEAILLPELHCRLDDALDLKVIGPDGKSRSFELYWREDTAKTTLTLAEKSARLEGQTFIWESLIDEKDRILVKSISIEVLSESYIGTVDIFGLKGGNWISLARQSALYASDGATRGEIEIGPYPYEGIRLQFTAYAKKPVPIGRVWALGQKPGRDYAGASVDLTYSRTDRKDSADQPETNLSATLPGSGLYLEELELFTKAQFNGRWRLERQVLKAGRKVFIPEMTGAASGVAQGRASLKIPVDRIWKDDRLNLNLSAPEDAASDISRLSVRIRLPRLIFLADMPGIYVVRTGLNSKVSVRDYPSAGRFDAALIEFDASRINADITEDVLHEQYRVGGAPFKAEGYAWRSDIQIPGPGYYRIILHRRAGLEENPHALRIVRNGLQHPYFFEKGEIKEEKLALREAHDETTNTTTWYLELPEASSRWEHLVLRASGIFHRTLCVERDLPRPVKGAVWKVLDWSNASSEASELAISLRGFPRTEKKIRLIMKHGDNEPLKLGSARALYEAPAIHFLADAADGYQIYGGCRDASAPSYDMQLIQDQLSLREPLPATVSEPQPLDEQPLTKAIFDLFAKNNWGLYAVLGLLAIVLMIIIARVFPKAAPKDPS